MEAPIDPLRLSVGDPHYKAYVGSPPEYDFMGATQFRLLCALGLRAKHRLLDFGCGSLRAGRFFLVYLDEGNYYGIEPNEWLIRDAVRNQLGEDLIRLKKPTFDHNSDFATDVFSTRFDFILAQSIFSHAGPDLVDRGLRSFRESLKDDGCAVLTFGEGRSDFQGKGWIYPGIVSYRSTTIHHMAREAGLFARRIPWYHPRQAWYVLARSASRLPGPDLARYLRGVVLFDPAFEESWRVGVTGWQGWARWLHGRVSSGVEQLFAKTHVITTEAVHAAVLPMKGSHAQHREAFGRLAAVLAERGVTPTGPPFARYFSDPSVEEANRVWEVGFPVPAGATPEGPFEIRELPATLAAVHLLRARKEKLTTAWPAMIKWTLRNGYVPNGVPMQVFKGDLALAPEVLMCVPVQERLPPHP